MSCSMDPRPRFQRLRCRPEKMLFLINESQIEIGTCPTFLQLTPPLTSLSWFDELISEPRVFVRTPANHFLPLSRISATLRKIAGKSAKKFSGLSG